MTYSTCEPLRLDSIPTWYNGVLFRSRLEARWAIFFDLCGFRWDYEPQGFEIDGVQYLPDFRLYNVVRRIDSEHDSADKPFFVEVKGVMDEASREKIWRLSRYYPVYVVGEVPFPKGPDDYFRAIVEQFFEDVIFFSYNTIDGDSYPAGLFLNDQGRPEIAGPDHELGGLDMERTMEALRMAGRARFDQRRPPLIRLA